MEACFCAAADMEAKCPYKLLLQHHCPLPACMSSPQHRRTPKPAEQSAGAASAPSNGQTGQHRCSLDLDLDLDFDFSSQPSTPVKDTESPEPRASAAARGTEVSGGGGGEGGGPGLGILSEAHSAGGPDAPEVGSIPGIEYPPLGFSVQLIMLMRRLLQR